MVPNRAEHVRKLQSNEYECQSIKNEGQRIPYRTGLQAHAGRKEMGALAAQIKSAGHDGKNPRSMELVSSQIRDVGRENTERDFNGTVIDPMLDNVHDRADHQSDQNAQ